METNIEKIIEDFDFKLPCSDKMWRRYNDYLDYTNSQELYKPSLYWKQREESFNVRYVNGFVYLNGLYNRNISKEMSIGDIFQKLTLRFEIVYRTSLRKLFFRKSNDPIPNMNSKEDYINERIHTYDTKYKKIVISLLGELYDIEHEDVYAKHMDIINCLEKNLDENSKTSFVEIGSGSGLLAFLLVKRLGFQKVDLIDLPVMVPICFFWLSSLVGESSISLPGEEPSQNTVYSLWNAGNVNLQNHSHDLAINVTSFQEMNHTLVKKYFVLIKKCLKPGGFFMCVNRWKKATDFWLYPFSLFKDYKTILFDEDLTSRHSSMGKIIVRKLIQLKKHN